MLTWDQADQACRSLRLLGCDDWVLPSREDLLSLVDIKNYDPAVIDSNDVGLLSAKYWTRDPVVFAGGISQSYAWTVSFLLGSTYFDPKPMALAHVIAVRYQEEP